MPSNHDNPQTHQDHHSREPVVHVIIVEYNPRWPALYEEERKSITTTLDNSGVPFLSIEHIGSTSVPGLAAKPIIDIQVTVEHLGLPDPYIEPLARLGYTFFPILGNAERYTFGKGIPHTHHLHIVQYGGEEYIRPLAFRNYLRTHNETAEQYVALKRELALRFHDDRRAYNVAKTDFIRAIVARARGYEGK